MKYLSLTIPGMNGTPIDSGLPQGVPTGGLFDSNGAPAGTGVKIISVFIILIVIFAVLTSLWFILKGGWDLITSRGHKDAMQRGRDRVLRAIVGLIFVFISFVIISLLNAFFGANLFPFLKFN